MNAKKIARRERALERFNVMSFNEWMTARGYERGPEDSLGMILTHNMFFHYNKWKADELASLSA